jgi:hypothetical protein
MLFASESATTPEIRPSIVNSSPKPSATAKSVKIDRRR